MQEEKNDVEDLFEELQKELDKGSDGEEPFGASAGKPREEVELPNHEIDNENDELSEEDISKLSPRAQKRIRDLAEQVETLKKPQAETPETVEEKKDPSSHDFKSVDDFLQAVEDPASRNLLEQFAKVMKGDISETLSPIEKQNNEARFESEFSKFENIEGLKDYKNDLKKTFMRDPKQPIDGLVGKTVLELSMARIKPVEKGISEARRDGNIDIDSLDLDQLYNVLDQNR